MNEIGVEYEIIAEKGLEELEEGFSSGDVELKKIELVT